MASELIIEEDGGYLATKSTYREYLEELSLPIDFPDPLDKDDPRYYRKYAHNLPP